MREEQICEMSQKIYDLIESKQLTELEEIVRDEDVQSIFEQFNGENAEFSYFVAARLTQKQTGLVTGTIESEVLVIDSKATYEWYFKGEGWSSGFGLDQALAFGRIDGPLYTGRGSIATIGGSSFFGLHTYVYRDKDGNEIGSLAGPSVGFNSGLQKAEGVFEVRTNEVKNLTT